MVVVYRKFGLYKSLGCLVALLDYVRGNWFSCIFFLQRNQFSDSHLYASLTFSLLGLLLFVWGCCLQADKSVFTKFQPCTADCLSNYNNKYVCYSFYCITSIKNNVPHIIFAYLTYICLIYGKKCITNIAIGLYMGLK